MSKIVPPFTYVLEHSLRMRIYDILFEHIAESKNSLACSLSLSPDLRRQEAKYRIYCLRDDDSEVSPHTSSCLANYRLPQVSTHCCVVFVLSVQ